VGRVKPLPLLFVLLIYLSLNYPLAGFKGLKFFDGRDLVGLPGFFDVKEVVVLRRGGPRGNYSLTFNFFSPLPKDALVYGNIFIDYDPSKKAGDPSGSDYQIIFTAGGNFTTALLAAWDNRARDWAWAKSVKLKASRGREGITLSLPSWALNPLLSPSPTLRRVASLIRAQVYVSLTDPVKFTEFPLARLTTSWRLLYHDNVGELRVGWMDLVSVMVAKNATHLLVNLMTRSPIPLPRPGTIYGLALRLHFDIDGNPETGFKALGGAEREAVLTFSLSHATDMIERKSEVQFSEWDPKLKAWVPYKRLREKPLSLGGGIIFSIPLKDINATSSTKVILTGEPRLFSGLDSRVCDLIPGDYFKGGWVILAPG